MIILGGDGGYTNNQNIVMSISVAVAVDTPFGSQSPLPSPQKNLCFLSKHWSVRFSLILWTIRKSHLNMMMLKRTPKQDNK